MNMTQPQFFKVMDALSHSCSQDPSSDFVFSLLPLSAARTGCMKFCFSQGKQKTRQRLMNIHLPSPCGNQLWETFITPLPPNPSRAHTGIQSFCKNAGCNPESLPQKKKKKCCLRPPIGDLPQPACLRSRGRYPVRTGGLQ